MEMTLHLQRPLDCKGAAINFTHFRNMPTLGSFSVLGKVRDLIFIENLNQFLESKGLIRIKAMAHMRANSDYSRRHPRRSAIPKTKFSAPKRFPSRPQVGTKTHKRDPHHEEEEQSVSSQSSKNFLSTKQLSEVVGDDKAESSVSDSIVRPSSNVMRQTKALDAVEASAQGNDYVELVEELHNREDLGDLFAEENFSSGRKFFVFPEIIRANQVIEVFFNRSLSVLANEPDVLIKGAFNGWRWRSFTEKMHKSDLHGDWWSCKVYVPREAYRIDFVFFNGVAVYENNNQKDFSVAVEGGMDETLFEEFLLEELQKKLQRLAAEQAEKDRKAEEKRHMEAEKTAIEADRAQARLEVKKRQEACQRVMRLAVKSVQGLWHMKRDLFKGENRIRLYYNRRSRPLEYSKDLWIHGGYNNWIDGLYILERLIKSEEKDGDWWYADVIVPGNALILDWVFADGPPQKAKVYDNNNNQDFHASISKVSEDKYWMEEENRIFKELQKERRLNEKAKLEKAEKIVRMKAEMKERALKRFFLSQKHVVYTEPTVVHAGKMVKVFHNPSSTVLNGKLIVWFRCSFNRWTHRNGPLPPQKMVPTTNGTHFQAIGEVSHVISTLGRVLLMISEWLEGSHVYFHQHERQFAVSTVSWRPAMQYMWQHRGLPVKVPLDAYIMDFVFSEREDGGIYDNKMGMDYHIPVTGGVAKEPPMHIIHISVEMAPIAKVGGLGDVVTSLSRAVQELGHHVDIILPKYDCLKLNHVKDFHYHQAFSWGGTEIKVWRGRVEGLSVYFLEPQNGMFWVGCIYGRNNDGDRFGFFCHAALEFLLQSEFRPDILHCHDWSSAPVAWLFKEHYKHYGLSNARVIFTIHNLEFGIHQIGKAMSYSDKATTVSNTYSKEVSGNPAISPHLYKFHGILNGIDPEIWDPYNDNHIPVSYTSENVIEGKRAAKEALQQKLGLDKSDHPLVGIITRLTVQKGIDLIKHAIGRTLDRNGQVVLLGSAPDPRIQNDFVNLANQLHSSRRGQVRLCLTYDEPLSHLIYAGSDFILVPSIFEPCGLTQLVAMRYGSIPLVRKTGGLYDTVFDVDHDKERAQSAGLEPNGFSFEVADSSGVDYALNRAISAWYDSREWFNQLCKRVMEQDWSWNRPALDYIELYYAAHK